MKIIQKALALLVTFCLSLQAVPIYALDLNSGSRDIKKTQVEDTNIEKRTVLGEVISKREENKKYFKMSDGSEKVNIYGSQVHFKESGKFEEINNELILKDNNYENKKAPYKVRYEKESTGNNLIELEKNGYTLSMSLNNSKKVKAEISKKENKTEKEEIPNLASVVEYNNIQNGIDLTYTNLSNKVKESIILNDKKASKKFEYLIKTNKNLKAEISDHNIVNFKDGNNIIFSLDAPYMYDREFNLSTNIDIKIKENYLIRLMKL